MQCRRYEGARRIVLPLITACAPLFDLLKILYLKHQVTAKQQTMMEKKNNYVQT